MDFYDLVPIPYNWIDYSDDILILLGKDTDEYKKVEELVDLDNITSIHRVQNDYLFGRYLLKKKLYSVQGDYVERTLLHATWRKNVESIVTDNLDYRLVIRGRFGTGVSFTPLSTYANKEGCHKNKKKKKKNNKRAMIVAKVLVGKACPGFYGIKLPHLPFDTTIQGRKLEKTNVIVKYYDDEYYPEYVVYYDY